jgi:hypothetical protein
MARWCSTLMIGGLLTALMLVPTARAADGRIVFSGSVVEATCAVDDTALGALLAQGRETTGTWREAGCSGQAAGAHQGVLHTVVVSSISARQSEVDQLLGYFAGYLRSQGSAPARLVTRTFE